MKDQCVLYGQQLTSRNNNTDKGCKTW